MIGEEKEIQTKKPEIKRSPVLKKKISKNKGKGGQMNI